MESTFKLGKVFGIPIGIHYTWLIALVLITMSLIAQFAASYPHWGRFTHFIVGLVTAVLLFASVLIHELAHSLVALAKGIPVHSIVLFIFGGISQTSREASTPLAEFLIAVVGPFTSFAIGGLSYGIGMLVGDPAQPLPAMFAFLAYINVVLGVFNLIPGFPLDGGRVLRSIVWGATKSYERSTRISATVGKAISYIFILGGVMIAFSGNFVSGLWLAFIGWFLLNAAQASTQELTLREALAGVKASDLMTTDCLIVQRDMSLDAFIQDYLLGTGRRCFLVADENHLLGIVTPHNLSGVQRDRIATMIVGDVMTPFDRVKSVRPDELALEVLRRMDSENVNQLPVVEDHRLLGLVGRASLLNRIRNYLEFHELTRGGK